jgi:hypothetical protein
MGWEQLGLPHWERRTSVRHFFQKPKKVSHGEHKEKIDNCSDAQALALRSHKRLRRDVRAVHRGVSGFYDPAMRTHKSRSRGPVGYPAMNLYFMSPRNLTHSSQFERYG